MPAEEIHSLSGHIADAFCIDKDPARHIRSLENLQQIPCTHAVEITGQGNVKVIRAVSAINLKSRIQICFSFVLCAVDT
ncbi:MAG: hypothetical protein CR990_00665 [Desulfococcus sp.]|nr:MAG: hypothetical protein CR990_00665 [Desulfococcus sp.]